MAERRVKSAEDPFSQAFVAWRALLGERHATRDPSRLAAAGQATFATAASLAALLEPADREQAAACVAIAARHGISLHPVSRGCNWGYGSKVPPADGLVLLHLGRLDRITAHDEAMAYVSIEPGVSFAALANFLQRRGSSLLPPMIGGSPEASVLGNALSRGIGKGPYFSMASRCCGLEVVLPDGEILRTGFAAAALAPLVRDAPGPALDGLFLQSNLGIVTEAAFWLEPAPALQEILPLLLPDGEALAPLLERVRRPLQRGDRRLQIELINDYRIAMMGGRYPVDGAGPLPRSALAPAMGELAGARWLCVATLWGDSEAELVWRRAEMEALFEPWREGLWPPERLPPGSFQPRLNGMACAYWRKTGPMPDDPDPDRDRCGLLWVSPLLPMDRTGVEALVVLEACIAAHGFEPAISLRLDGGRAMFAILSLVYDRDRAGADQAAATCHAALAAEMRRLGVAPYRLSLLDQADGSGAGEPARAILRRLKQQIDPGAILSPGYYGL